VNLFWQVLPSENCHTHGMPLALWCHTCCAAICRACATQQDHPGHQVKSQGEAKEQLVSEVCTYHMYLMKGFSNCLVCVDITSFQIHFIVHECGRDWTRIDKSKSAVTSCLLNLNEKVVFFFILCLLFINFTDAVPLLYENVIDLYVCNIYNQVVPV
jgi:hypothetical protein